MRTSFHHQPEAQHPKSPAIETPAGRLPHLYGLAQIGQVGMGGELWDSRCGFFFEPPMHVSACLHKLRLVSRMCRSLNRLTNTP